MTDVMASLPDCTTHHGCKCREYVMARLPEYEAAVDALERVLAQADDETGLGACDGWVHPRADGSGHEPGQDAIHVLPFHHVGDECAFCEAADNARAVLRRLRGDQ